MTAVLKGNDILMVWEIDLQNQLQFQITQESKTMEKKHDKYCTGN